jgi:hypothetical protein
MPRISWGLFRKQIMKQQIVNRWNKKKVLFECEVPDSVPNGLGMRHALEQATAAMAETEEAHKRSNERAARKAVAK